MLPTRERNCRSGTCRDAPPPSLVSVCSTMCLCVCAAERTYNNARADGGGSDGRWEVFAEISFYFIFAKTKNRMRRPNVYGYRTSSAFLARSPARPSARPFGCLPISNFQRKRERSFCRRQVSSSLFPRRSLRTRSTTFYARAIPRRQHLRRRRRGRRRHRIRTIHARFVHSGERLFDNYDAR